MKVGVSAYLLHAGADYRSAGVSTYAYQLLRHLPHVDSDLDLVAFVGPDAPALPRVAVDRAPAPTSNPGMRIAWEQVALPLALLRRQIDLVHGTVNVIPWFAKQRSLVTVHDLSFALFPERFRPGRRSYLNVAVRLSVERADRVIAVSQQTRHDLIDLWDVSPRKVSVVYPGVGEQFRPAIEGAGALRERVTGGRPFILHVGTLEPRKNIDVLMRAYAEIRHRIPHALVLAGAPGWYHKPILELSETLGLKGDVIAAGYVPPADLPRWYNSADLFAYPSAYEGFGLPVLEAMACGVPTVISDAGALREVAGAAALSVPAVQEALGEVILRVLGDRELASKMREAGVERAARFTWARTAKETAALYARVGVGA